MPFSLASNASNELKALFPNLSSDRRFRSGPASLRNTPHKKQNRAAHHCPVIWKVAKLSKV